MAINKSPQPTLEGLFYWRVIGWTLVAIVTTLTLIPNPDGSALPVSVNDKVAHFVCYLALAGWFGCVRLGRNLTFPIVALVLMGAGLELVQLLSMYGRMFDVKDIVANCTGVLVGALLMRTPLRYSLLYVERLVN